MARVVFDHVSKSFGNTKVIEDFCLEIQDEEFMVLVGPSGCGKSTALRLIAGLEEISSGTISIGERVVNELPPKSRDIAMVFQSYALYPHMTVRENLEFGLKMRKMEHSQIHSLVREAAEILGISELLSRKPKQLSGGQRQRVAVGRAIVRKPAVFLFDEPLSNLDAKLRVQMRAELTKLQQRLKTTTVYVTHDQVEAMTMGHRIAVMNQGQLQQVGRPLELYDRPANVFVATFIGTPPMNLLPATISDHGEALIASGCSFPVPKSLRAPVANNRGRRVIVGFRPENLSSGLRVKDNAVSITVDVEAVELLGHEAIVHGRVARDVVIARFEPHHVPEIGQKLELSLPVQSIHLFEAESQQRIN